jgi:hypothetical protein
MVRPWILLSTAGRIARLTQEELYRIDHIFQSENARRERARAIDVDDPAKPKLGNVK